MISTFLSVRLAKQSLRSFQRHGLTRPFQKSRNFSNVALSDIRNIGIVAHIDAGKTTTSEYMLFLCGDISSVGRVDNGDTVMDFLPQERERGITIASAAISMPWRGHQLNLIDTPGHVDFTVEVERSCRVLDGVVVVVDAVSGVQAQTRTVWKQASRQGLPAIVFVNKMDRDGASYSRALRTVEKKLGVTTLPLQYPLFSIESDPVFEGYVDLLSMQAYKWMDLRSPEYTRYVQSTQHESRRDLYPHKVHQLHANANGGGVQTAEAIGRSEDELAVLWEDAITARAAMLETLAGLDEEFMEYYLDQGEVIAHDNPEAIGKVVQAIRRMCINRTLLPAVCGASLRGKGVNTLLDSVLAFLPNPLDRPPAIAVKIGAESKADMRRRMSGAAGKNSEAGNRKEITAEMDTLCSLAFKVVHDKSRGPLVFVRNYSGTLRSKQVLWNATKACKERLNQLLLVSADDLDGVEEVGAGKVACLVGLKATETGDTLVDFNGPLHSYVLDGLTVPKAVFSLVIEPEKSSQQTELEEALRILTVEDPSLLFEIEAETGQSVIRGIGELHLEIVIDKLKRQFGLAVLTGKAYVAYRESLDISMGNIQRKHVYDRTIGTKRMFASLNLEFEPLGTAAEPTVSISAEALAMLQTQDEKEHLLASIRNSLRRGPRGFPVAGIAISVLSLERDADTTVGALQACAAIAIDKVLSGTSRAMLEPLMELEVEAPSRCVGDILSDLTVTRRAQIKDVTSGLGDGDDKLAAGAGAGAGAASASADMSLITATVPLGTMLGYATVIRSMTQGEGGFSLEFLEYSSPMDAALVQKVLTAK